MELFTGASGPLEDGGRALISPTPDHTGQVVGAR